MLRIVKLWGVSRGHIDFFPLTLANASENAHQKID